MEVRRKVAIATMGVLGIAGVGVGTAFAQAGGSSPSKPATPVVANQTVPPSAAPEAPEPGGPDTDAVQEGDQTTPDTPGAAAEREAPEAGETAGVEEPGDENLPGGGHADPAGSVDHQFEGQE